MIANTDVCSVKAGLSGCKSLWMSVAVSHGHTATSRASAAAEKQVSTNASSYSVLTRAS